MDKIKISQLPSSGAATSGLYTIGVNAQNESVKVPLGALLSAIDAQILQNTGQAVFLGIPTIDLTAKTISFPSEGVVLYNVGRATSYTLQTTQVVNLGNDWMWKTIVWNDTNKVFEAANGSVLRNLAEGQYEYAIIRSIPEWGVLHINSWRYVVDGTEYRQDMPSALPATVASHTTTLASHTSSLASHTSSLASLDTKIGRVYNEAFFFGIPAIATGSGGATLTLPEKTDNRQNYFSLNNSSSPSQKSFNVKGTVTATAFNSDANTLMGSTCYLYLDVTELATQPAEEPDNGIYYTKNGTKVWVKGLKFKPAYSYSSLEPNQYLVGVVRFYYSRSEALIDTEGVIRLNATSYTIDGKTYNNRYPSAISDALAAVQEALGTVGSIGKLRVLHIGNSFGQDALSYIGDMVTADGTKIPADDLYVRGLLFGGSSISDWYTWFDTNAKRSATGKYDEQDPPVFHSPFPMDVHKGDNASPDINWVFDDYMQNYLKQPWDIVIVQQVSKQASDVANYSDLPSLIALIRRCCANANVKIGIQMPWAYNANTIYANICAATQQVAATCDIDFVIPTGTAVENARVAFDGDYEHNLTRDSSGHIGYGLGRYVVGSAWWEAVIKPWCGMSILGNTLTKSEAEPVGYDYIEVDNSNRHLAQWCAVEAERDKWAAVASADVPAYTAADKTAMDAAHKSASLCERMIEAERDIERTVTLLAGKQDTLVSGENIKTVNGQSLLGRGNMLIGDDWQFLVQYKTAEGATYPLPTADSFDGLLIHFTHEYRTRGTSIPIYWFSNWIGTYSMPTSHSGTVVLVEKRGDAIIFLAGQNGGANLYEYRVLKWEESCRNARPYFSIPASGALLYTDTEYINVYIKPRKDNE